jgi:hypothetical protein
VYGPIPRASRANVCRKWLRLCEGDVGNGSAATFPGCNSTSALPPVTTKTVDITVLLKGANLDQRAGVPQFAAGVIR